MSSAKRFEELECWKTARLLVTKVYQFTRETVVARDFGFREQICRASVSIMSNIAEGFESRTQVLFVEYLGRAKASAGEVRSQLYIAFDLKYLSKESFGELISLAELNSKQIFNLMIYLGKLPNKYRVTEDGSAYLT